MLGWILILLVSTTFVKASEELIRIPLVSRVIPVNELATRGNKYFKREIGYAPLVDEVVGSPPFLDLSYYGAVSIGNPPQTFLLGMYTFAAVCLLDIDTGSGVLWVADHNCVGCNVSDSQLYNPGLSRTSHNIGQKINLDYVLGTPDAPKFLINR